MKLSEMSASFSLQKRSRGTACRTGLVTLAMTLFAFQILPIRPTFSTENTYAVAAKTKSSSSSVDNSIGRKIPNFVLKDTNGELKGLSDFADDRFLVVAFMGTQCPIGNAYVPDLIRLNKEFAEQSVKVIGIYPNLADSPEDVAEHIREFKIDFPTFQDSQQATIGLFGATRTPEIFVLDRRRQVRYQGRVDDRIGYDYKRAKPRRADLLEAVKELVAGKEVSVESTKPVGCKITLKSALKADGKVTYTGQVAKIFAKRCASCHHAGTAAPFSLTSYEEARDWSEMIKEVVQTQRMPPWEADPRFGKFSNDLRMTTEEIHTLTAWVESGAPFGDKAKLPESQSFAKGWTIPQPDHIFEMPEEFTVKANGTVAYKYFVTPTNFKEDRWVQASEAKPGNRAAVHHIIGYVRPKGGRGIGGLPAVAGYAPGEEPMVFPQGMGFKLPAGADIVWQVHYTPTGKVEKDRSEIGLIFCKERPERAVIQSGAINTRFEIPPHAENYQVKSTQPMKTDVELISLMPHMHLRGKSFRYIVKLPDGTDKTLLDIPDYDFNWQHRYRFDKPYFLPKGTVIECVAHFDNSAENPANPDPNKTVKWGDQTWEEMMIGYFTYVKPKKSGRNISKKE